MSLDLIIERFGLVGLMLVGMGFAIVILFRRVSELQDARVADQERFNERLTTLTHEVKDAMRAAGGDIETLTEIIKERRGHG